LENINCEIKKAGHLILYNAKIYTMESENKIYEALEIKDDKIFRVGSNKEILENKEIGSIAINLHGNTVVPGLIDTHTHFSSAALSELKEELLNPKSVKEILDYIKMKTETLAKGEWIYLRNIYPTRLLEGRFPTLEELDQVAPEHPVFINAAYASQVNTKALEICKINKDTIMTDGKICKNKTTGKLNGMLLGRGELVKRNIPMLQYTRKEMEEAFLILQEKYSQVGITSIVEAVTPANVIEVYNEIYETGKLGIRIIYTKLPDAPMYSAEEFSNYSKLVKTPTEWGKTGFLKLFIDGGFLTGTSYMKKSYSKGYSFLDMDAGFKGNMGYNKEQLIYWIEKALENNLQMTAHCTGNASLDILLSAYNEVNKKQSIINKRFTVIHANFIDAEALKKIKELGIILISQPMWHYMDSFTLTKIIDEETLRTFLPYKDILITDVIATGGSDHMIKHNSIESVNPYNPFVSMYNLVTRREKSGKEINVEQKISPYDAMKMYTSNATYLTFDEDKKGTLEKGKLADLVVLSKDYFTCAPEEIPNIESKLTIVGGKIVYSQLPTTLHFDIKHF
jgi:predicted amidohydrolase YtcJ